MVFHTKRYRGRVHNLQTVLDDVKVSDFVVLFGVVVFLRIAVVNAVDIFGLQQYVRLNFRSPERRACVGAEIRVARTARHDDDATFFKMADRTAKNVRLCDSGHFDCRHNARRHARVFQSVLHCKRVDDGCEHTHMVGSRSVHIRALTSAPEVAAADDDTDLDAHIPDFRDLFHNARDNGVVQSESVFTRKGFAADFNDDSCIFVIHIVSPDSKIQKKGRKSVLFKR